MKRIIEFAKQTIATAFVFGCMLCAWGLFAILLGGCTPKQTVAPVTLPPICPAPRELPNMPDIVPSLPNLPTTSQDYAADLLANRIASQQAYAECVSRYTSLREWAYGH